MICCDRFFIFLSLAALAPHQPLPKPHYPLLRPKLTSLVKGEVLSPERIRATTGGIVFLLHPFRFSDTSVNNPSIVGSASHCNRSSPLHKGAKGDSALPTLPKPHFPSKSTISLPPLSKGGGLTAKHKLLPCNVLLAIHPSFLFTKLFRHQDGGIATPTFCSAPTLPKPHYPTRFSYCNHLCACIVLHLKYHIGHFVGEGLAPPETSLQL